jgi:cbb3-type cytochrome oxidase subunit 3
MSTYLNIALSAWTVVVALLFAGVAVWSWRPARQHDFGEAALIPFEPEELGAEFIPVLEASGQERV